MTTMPDSLRWIPIHEGQSGIQQTLVTNTTVVMTISSLQGSDAGRYKCLLVMNDGTEETAEFELMVRRKGEHLSGKKLRMASLIDCLNMRCSRE